MDMQDLYQAGHQLRLDETARQRLLAGCAAHRRKRNHWGAVAAAACALVALGTVALLWYEPDAAALGQWAEDSILRGEQDIVGPQEPQLHQTGVEDVAVLPMLADEIHINECGEDLLVSDMALYYDPERYEDVALTEEEMEAYFGRDIGIDPVPEGLEPDPRGAGTRFVRELATGAWVYDVVQLSFWSDWGDWEQDGPRQMVWEGGSGFTVTMSRTGLISDCIVIFDEDMIPSTIAGCQVTIGHRVMGTMYNENHEPQVEYDVYVAKFVLDGVEYEVQTENLGEDTLIQILHALLEA